MKYLTIRQLNNRKGKIWADHISQGRSRADEFLWYAISELAEWLNHSVELEDLFTRAQVAMVVLRGAQSYLIDIGEPRPYPVEALLLRVDRLNAFLEPGE